MMRSLLVMAGVALMFSGCCVDRMSGRYCGPGGCDNRMPSCGPGCSDCPYQCDNRSFLKSLVGCQGCGEVYWNEWANDPPDCCDPCDQCGHFTGPRCCPPRTLYSGWRNFWGFRNCGGGCNSCGAWGGGCESCGSSCGGSACGGGTSCGKYGCSTCGSGYAAYGGYGAYGGPSGGCASCGGGGEMPAGMPLPSPAPSNMSDPFQDDPDQGAPAAPKSSRAPTPAKRITSTVPRGPSLPNNYQTATRPWAPVRAASMSGDALR